MQGKHSALLGNLREGGCEVFLIDWLVRRQDFKTYAGHLDYKGVREVYLHKRWKWFWQQDYKVKGAEKIK